VTTGGENHRRALRPLVKQKQEKRQKLLPREINGLDQPVIPVTEIWRKYPIGNCG
jgi:hypothetical protein